MAPLKSTAYEVPKSIKTAPEYSDSLSRYPMTDYTAPLRDITFSMFEVFDYQHHYETRFQGADVNPELIGVILEEFGRFCSEQLSPLNAVGDRER